jgi:hypothetical protein
MGMTTLYSRAGSRSISVQQESAYAQPEVLLTLVGQQIFENAAAPPRTMATIPKRHFCSTGHQQFVIRFKHDPRFRENHW